MMRHGRHPSRASVLPRVLLLGLWVAAAACSPAAVEPTVATAPRVDLAAAFAATATAEASRAATATPYLDLIDQAIGQPHDPWAAAVVIASLDALVTRRIAGLDGSLEHAIIHRSRSALREAAQRLRGSYDLARAAAADRAQRGAAGGDAAALMAARIAESLHRMALRVGSIDGARRWRHRSGCAHHAAVAGPTAWPPLEGLEGSTKLDAHEPLVASLPGVPPFARPAAFYPVVADGCDLDVNATSALRGVRLAVVDVHNPRAQRIGVSVTTTSAAEATLGGEPLLQRPYGAGGGRVTRIASADAEAGRLRLVVRVAQNLEGDDLQIAIWSEEGAPLATVAPAPGDGAPARAAGGRLVPLVPAESRWTEPQIALAASTWMALGEARQAAELLESPQAPSPADSTALVDLLRTRAWAASRHVPRAQLMTLIQAAAERVGESCEACWEGRIVRASIAEERRGRGAGVFAGLEQLGVTPAAGGWTDRLESVELAFAATRAHGAGLLDVAEQSYEALQRRAAGSLLLADVDAVLHARAGDDLVQAACHGGTSRATPRCLHAHLARGDLTAALREIRWQRRLRDSPWVLQATELGQLMAHGRLEQALAVYEAMLPAKRTLAALGASLALGSDSGASSGGHWIDRARRWFRRDGLAARDAPYAYEPLARLLGVAPDLAPGLEADGRRLVARDRVETFLPGAGTAVLRHVEEYRLESTGLLHYVSYDLRRVSGTTDVAAGAWTAAPTIDGRSTSRTLRRRIHKRDGRVLDPDPGAEGAQGHTELSQLEAGDYVEAIHEGWALPDDSGQLVVDTPDLLPMRTSVASAEIRLIRPADLDLAVWSHRLLGEGQTTRRGTEMATVWRLRDQPPRRMEEGVPVMEARAAISFGTDSYQRIARSIGERLRSLDDQQRFMAEWVREQLGDEPLPEGEQIARVVAAVGHEIKRADPEALSDFAASLGGGPQRETARHILERGRGSRSWVIHRALRELGIASQIAVSETRPFSADLRFPPHVGRFRHPLVLAEVDGKRIWIDADVEGPPLPPGRISPELRGRQALLTTGEMVPVHATSGAEPDEIDLRLSVDPQGDAQGTFVALIHGRAAQRLSEAFETVVGSDRTSLLRNVVLGWLPWADVRDVTLSSEQGAWQIALRAAIVIPGFATPEGRDGRTWSLPGILPVHQVFPRPEASTLGARYAAQAGRTSALAISDPLLFHLRRRIELPAGIRVVRLAEALAVRSEHLEAQRAVSHTGRVIAEDFRLNLPVGTVPVAVFEPFLADVRRVDDGFRHGTIIRSNGEP